VAAERSIRNGSSLRCARQVARGYAGDGVFIARLRLSTKAMKRETGGMPAQELEDVLVLVPDTPMRPPLVLVDHDRFLGAPHVLSDRQLCIYLDPAREWDPRRGVQGFLFRLYGWFADAVANRFDPGTALFHAVGGHSHFARRAEVVVCREEFDDPRTVSLGWLSRVGDQRFDLHRVERDGTGERVVVVRSPTALPAGPGQTVGEVFANLDAPVGDGALDAWLRRARARVEGGSDDVHFVLSVPGPSVESAHLLVARVDLRHQPRSTRIVDLQVEWCPMSDERPSITTRRDKDRPVNAFHQADVVVLGCGGLGSWIAEYIVRAGCRSIEVVDHGTIVGGHLVRQNYTERDVATHKAPALAERLRAIAPDVTVAHAVAGDVTARTEEVLSMPGGFVIDATVSTAMALSLDRLVGTVPGRQATVAQVATDVSTGSLGMVVVSMPHSSAGVVSIDEAAGLVVRADGELEAYHTFWEPSEHDELVPARGCSVPTFHGSAADLAAVAATQTNLIGRHSLQESSGTYLFGLPHTGVAPHFRFLPSQHGASG
jgi:hypothetical protein